MGKNNLSSFKRRMVMISALPVIILLAVTIVSETMLSRVNEGVDRIYHDRVIPLDQLKHIADAYAVGVIDGVNKANAGIYSKGELLQEIASAEETIDEHWQAYLKTQLTADEERLVGAAKSKFAKADAAVSELKAFVGTLDGNLKGQLDRFDGPLYAEIDAIGGVITDLVDLQLEVAAQEREHAADVYGMTVWLLAGICVASLGLLAFTGWQTYRSMSAPLAVAQLMDEVSEKADLTLRTTQKGSMADSFNRLMQRFQELVSSVANGAEQLSSAAEEMTAITRDSADGARRQHAESEQVATAVNELTASVEEVARSTSAAASSSADAKKVAGDGSQTVQSVVNTIRDLANEIDGASHAITQLNQHSNQISTVLDVIRGIAEQTNLLALNAAIEAARAGEKGRGFAVVADEVRTLAQRTQESTSEIEQMVERLLHSAGEANSSMARSQERVNESVEVAGRAGESLTLINSSSENVSAMTIQIANMSEEQASVVEEINRSITAISDAAHSAATGSEQAATASEQLTRMAEQFRAQAAVFKI